jgi:hypothetical protein
VGTPVSLGNRYACLKLNHDEYIISHARHLARHPPRATSQNAPKGGHVEN